MARSGASPKKLSVFASLDNCVAGFSSRAMCHVADPRLARLLAEGPIIHTLSISCGASKCIHRLYEAISLVRSHQPRAWDRITRLEIRVRHLWDEATEVSLRNAIDNCLNPDIDASDSFFPILPLVTAFSLDVPSNCHPRLIPTLRPFLSRLTTLRIDCNWEGDALVRVLRCYHQGSLQELILACKGSNVDRSTSYIGDAEWFFDIFHDQEKQFVLPNLGILRFIDLRPYTFKIVYFFQTPALVELDLAFPTVPDEGAPAEDNPQLTCVSDECMSYDFPDFIQRSKCQKTLKHLSLRGSLLIDNGDIIDWLDEKLLPSLSHLEFDGVYLPPEFFDFLRPQIPGMKVLDLSQLRTIKILNLPSPLHSLGLYHREMQRAARPSTGRKRLGRDLPNTNVEITIKMRDD
jgi:hypothetical protein